MAQSLDQAPDQSVQKPFAWQSLKMGSKKWKFVPRMIKFRHLEFDSALHQVMWTVINPWKLYRHHKAQKELRDTLARDDPAFLLLLISFMSMAGFVYGLWLHLSFLQLLLSVLWAELGDLLASGAIVATLLWVFSNKVLRPDQKWFSKLSSSGWGNSWPYCFDVHLNAFCPLALGLFGIQLLLWPILSHKNMVSLVVGNTLWVISLFYYIFITFLGYALLQSKKSPALLLFAALPVLLLYVLSLFFQWNFADLFGSFLKWRCGG